jgi:anti-anti-sigma factor
VVSSRSGQTNGSVLDIAIERSGDTGSICLSGQLDRSESERFEQQLRGLASEQAVRNLTLDMQELRSIDSSGLDVIRMAWASADQTGVDAILVRASSEVRLALEQSGLDRVLPVVYECPDGPADW